MKKIVLILMLSFATLFLVMSEETSVITNETTETMVNQGASVYFETLKGRNISVTISTIDTTLTGKLVEVYDDGIVILTAFNNTIFIYRNSIAYFRFGK